VSLNIFYTPRPAAAPPVIGNTILRGLRIDYESIGGLAVYQGDLILGKAGDVARGRFSGRFAVDNRPGVRPQSATIAPNFQATTGLWPLVNGVVRVPYTTTGVNAANTSAAIAESNTQLVGIVQWVPAAASDANLVNFAFDASD
jgi:hypothetical protein